MKAIVEYVHVVLFIALYNVARALKISDNTLVPFVYHFYLLVTVQMLKAREETRVNFLKQIILFFPGLKKPKKNQKKHRNTKTK